MDTAGYIRELSTTSAGKEMAFSASEYQERVAKVRKAMDETGLDALLVTHPPNLYYLAGYYTFGVGNHACLVLPREGDPTLQVTSLEVPAAVVNSWVRDVVSADWHEQTGAAAQLADIVKDKGLEAKGLGIEPSRTGLLPYIYNQLQRALPAARFQDASDVVAQVRMVKSTAEIEYLKKAAKCTQAAINASLAAVKPGVLDSDVAKVGYEAMIGAGSEFMSVQPIVTSGERTSYTHATYRRVPIEVGDTVFLEYGGCYQRYTAPMMRTAVVGEPSDDVRRVAEAVKATVSRIIETARPGRTHHEVAMEAKKARAPVASETFFSEVYGYNVGIGFPPTWAEGLTFLAEGVDQPLLPGMPFHLPISYRIPGAFGVGLSETILITETGCEILTEQERDLHIVPV